MTAPDERATSGPAVRFRDPQIEMAHGAGGIASRRLIDSLIAPLLLGSRARGLADAAELPGDGAALVMTADGFVVTPLTFNGGSIGELAINGTVNDLVVSGAIPIAITVTLVLEAGLPTAVLEAELRAMALAAAKAGVPIIGGDTKVVDHGKADQMYISTAGVGRQFPNIRLGSTEVRVGDRILLSGPIGDHGITILLARGELDLEADLRSDTRSVLPMVQPLLEALGPAVHWMRDPTRGGVASALNELALDTGLGITITEESLPIRPAVRGACELLGLDPLHIANEGQFLAVIAPEAADRALAVVRAAPGGKEARFIGEVGVEPAAAVLSVSSYGGTRIIDMLVGDPLPRIC